MWITFQEQQQGPITKTDNTRCSEKELHIFLCKCTMQHNNGKSLTRIAGHHLKITLNYSIYLLSKCLKNIILFFFMDRTKLCMLIPFSKHKYHKCNVFLNFDLHICGFIWVVLIYTILERVRVENQTEISVGKETVLKETGTIHHHHLCQITKGVTRE